MLFRPPPPRTALPARLSSLLSTLGTAARRNRVAGRFTGPVDWLRLVVLGVVLVNLAALALAHAIFNGNTPNGSGLSAIFSGLMLWIAVIRIGRPAIYLDWIVSALLYIGLGFVLAGHAALVSTHVFGLFCLLFIASALLRTWIGATLEAGGGTAWLMAGGLTGLFCVVWMIVMRLGAIDVNPDLILSVDLMVHGVSIAGFGLSLRATSP
jgi:uncharacterized membrane protein HdeD (DUF308 family)